MPGQAHMALRTPSNSKHFRESLPWVIVRPGPAHRNLSGEFRRSLPRVFARPGLAHGSRGS
eukprot:2285053-Alexandrium_andersonii.AAC.1